MNIEVVKKNNVYLSMIFIIIGILFIMFKLRDRKTEVNLGEEEVAKILSRLPRRKYRVLNDLMIPTYNGGTSQIDHVVVSRFGIFVIETKDYNGIVYGGKMDRNWKQKTYEKEIEFHNPIKQNYGHIRALKGILREYADLEYISIITFTDKTRLNINIDDENIVYFSRLYRSIRKFKGRKISKRDMKSIEKLIKSENIKSNREKKKHVKRIETKVKEDERMIRRNKCPRCEGKLLVIRGKHNKFIGCSNYPKCRFTDNYK